MSGINSVIPSLGISLTSRCQLSCVYCPPNGEDIISCSTACDERSIIDIMTAARQNGVSVIRITGGEPLLMPSTAQRILQEATSLQFKKIILNTNGILIEKNIDWMAQFAGKFECKVSIDAVDKKLFNDITGADCVDKVINGATIAKLSGIDVTVNCVITKRNADHAYDVIKFCESHGFNAKLFDIYDFGGTFFGRWRDNYHDISDIISRLKELYPSLPSERLPGGRGIEMLAFRLGEKNKMLVVSHGQAHKSGRLFTKICQQCQYFPCSVGRFQLALRSDGLLSICRLREDLGSPLSGAEITEIKSRVSEMVMDFEQCWIE